MEKLTYSKIQEVEITRLYGNIMAVKVLHDAYGIQLWRNYTGKPHKSISYNSVPKCVWEFVAKHEPIHILSHAMMMNGYSRQVHR